MLHIRMENLINKGEVLCYKLLAIIAVNTSVNSIACKSHLTLNYCGFKVTVYNLLIQNSNHNPPSPIAVA